MRHENCQVTPPRGVVVLAINFKSGNVWAVKENVFECRRGRTTSVSNTILQSIALTKQDAQRGESPRGKCVRHLLPTLTHKSGVSPIHFISKEVEQMAKPSRCFEKMPSRSWRHRLRSSQRPIPSLRNPCIKYTTLSQYEHVTVAERDMRETKRLGRSG